MHDLSVIEGNIMDSKADVIGQQCNCVTMGKAKGLAAQIFARFPYADVYKDRTEHNRAVAGTWSLHGNGKEERYVLNIYGQYYPGESKYNSDSEDLRLGWFQKALTSFLKAHPNRTLALPHGIGCGMAGGSWGLYERAIKEASASTGADILLYQYVPGAALRGAGIALKKSHDRDAHPSLAGVPREGTRPLGDSAGGSNLHR